MRAIGCTIATGTHLAGAEVAQAAWRRHHPGSDFRILLADADRASDGEPPPSVLYPEDLGLDADEIAVRRGIYSAFEYATSLTPRLLRFLLAGNGVDAVVYTDPDTGFLAGLDGVVQAGG